jgi:hypothetical protein
MCSTMKLLIVITVFRPGKRVSKELISFDALKRIDIPLKPKPKNSIVIFPKIKNYVDSLI